MTDVDEARIHAMIANACLHAGASDEIAQDLRAYLARHDIGDEDIDAIVSSPPRLALYRRLVRNNLFDVVAKMMPRTRARLNAIDAGSFDVWVAKFLEEAAPRTHYLRDVPAEFLAWIDSRWSEDASIPRYAIDLARHEHVEFEIGAAPTPSAAPPLADVAIDRALVFADAVRAMHYRFAVHELAADESSEPEARDVSLLVYRDAGHAARFLELTPLAAAIVAHLRAGETLGAALPAACDAHHVAMSDAILADIARLLADLGERGVLLGARA